VARLGPHPARRLGLDLATEDGLARWTVAACLLVAARDEAAAEAARAALAARGLDMPAALAGAAPAALARLLEAAGVPRPEACALRLVRASASLCARYAGSLSRLLAGCDSLDEAGATLVSLAPGLGPATAVEILRPLRDRFTAARELSLAPAARAAAVHVGLLREGEDEEGEPGALRAALAREPSPPDLADVEAALTRLGRAACRRGATLRCLLAADCPAVRARPSQA
jgi:hypothetical protein